MCSGSFLKSEIHPSGKIISLIPDRRAAIIFSLIPPTGKTLPVRVISPVMARGRLMVFALAREIRAVAIVTPALGPSFGVAPSGTWIWIKALSKYFLSILKDARFALT